MRGDVGIRFIDLLEFPLGLTSYAVLVSLEAVTMKNLCEVSVGCTNLLGCRIRADAKNSVIFLTLVAPSEHTLSTISGFV